MHRRIDELIKEDERRRDPGFNEVEEALAKAKRDLEAKIKKKVDMSNIRPSKRVRQRMDSTGLLFMDKADI